MGTNAYFFCFGACNQFGIAGIVVGSWLFTNYINNLSKGIKCTIAKSIDDTNLSSIVD